MPSKILIIDGHPDPDRARFIHALADRYARGATSAGHAVRTLDIAWADHLVMLFPLWLGDVPGLLKMFLEQVARPGFAFAEPRGKGLPRKLLKGRSARIVVTMGMPALFYRWYYRAHSVKNLQRNILGFCGIAPVRTTLVGMVEGMSAAERSSWLDKLEALGRKAQ